MKRYLPIVPALSYMGLIYFLSCRPSPELLTDWPVFLGMKLLHLLEYGFLSFLWLWGLGRSTRWPLLRLIVVAVSITFLWGVSDEIHQYFVPGRSARAADALTDLVGAVLMALLWRRLAALQTPLTRRMS